MEEEKKDTEIIIEDSDGIVDGNLDETLEKIDDVNIIEVTHEGDEVVVVAEEAEEKDSQAAILHVSEPEAKAETHDYNEPSVTVEVASGVDQVVMSAAAGGPLVVTEHSIDSDAPASTEEDEITLSGWSKRVVVITGASSGIGEATAHRFSLYADIVYNLDLVKQEEDNINFIRTDVTKAGQVSAAIKRIYEKEGQIDVLINNAGVGFCGAAESTTPETMSKIFDTNFMGVANTIAAVAPYMREQRRGKIINISSLAACFPLPFQSFYSASKAAVTNYSNAVRTELAPFNIKVTNVMFAEVKTNFTENRIKNTTDDKEYKYRLAKSVGKFEYAEQVAQGPEWIAKKLFRLSNKKGFRPNVVFGKRNKCHAFFARFTCQKSINRMIARKY